MIDEDELERELDVIDMAKKEKYEEEHGQGADAALREVQYPYTIYYLTLCDLCVCRNSMRKLKVKPM